MRHRKGSRRAQVLSDFHIPPHGQSSATKSPKWCAPETVYDAWLSSREMPGKTGSFLVPGASRPFTLVNARLALFVLQTCIFDFLKVLWSLHPLRTTLMMTLNVVRSLFPAFRGYSQALIVDELQSLIVSGSFTWSRLLWLITSEILRRMIEGLLDSYSASNESIVLSSARFFIEYKQMEHRVRLDVPTLADPLVRDLLQESDIFARSFSGGGFGFLSPLDFIHVFSSTIEIASHLFLVVSLTRGISHFGVFFLAAISAVLPLVLSWFHCYTGPEDSPSSMREARAADRQERMRNMAYSEGYRPEIALFGLGDWILKSWSGARRIVLTSEHPSHQRASSVLAHFNLADLTYALQNIPFLLLLQSSSTSLGSLTIYRSSIQCIIYASGNLVTTIKMAFQGIFLTSAFCASMKLKPRLQPKNEELVPYSCGADGLSIDVRELSYTYPGCIEPALRNVNLSIKSGETLAIVGYNGSGKSTLARILLRIVDYDRGSLLVNGVELRHYSPSEYHRHLSAVFQGFSKFNSSVKENVGLGNVDKMGYRPAINAAVHLAEADNLMASLPDGLKTQLESPGFESISYPGYACGHVQRHGLSGGEWQRIALARAFMRANEPNVDLLLFDEPTSSLDAHAQNQIFDTITKISRTPSGKRRKTVIFITHRLSTARRADKVAMMENGTISEFGTHDELIKKNGPYAALYHASI
ncbi:hypothetical protein K443DRAFT_672501 [Laccaria amethystina LaAM-08-1]|uniref:ABC transporter domain-containing protein n=1 Tax=Laccaria amethystina LaAM-08-1 TaxID=1095629 RepID=A0A0C9YDP6_9AGAR|nr:hypothetical protein K443DRAFT_672501 [Laccaria amethystina LaAM-08-1]